MIILQQISSISQWIFLYISLCTNKIYDTQGNIISSTASIVDSNSSASHKPSIVRMTENNIINSSFYVCKYSRDHFIFRGYRFAIYPFGAFNIRNKIRMPMVFSVHSLRLECDQNFDEYKNFISQLQIYCCLVGSYLFLSWYLTIEISWKYLHPIQCNALGYEKYFDYNFVLNSILSLLYSFLLLIYIYIYIYIHLFIYIHEGRSQSSKPQPKRRFIAKYFFVAIK